MHHEKKTSSWRVKLAKKALSIVLTSSLTALLGLVWVNVLGLQQMITISIILSTPDWIPIPIILSASDWIPILMPGLI